MTAPQRQCSGSCTSACTNNQLWCRRFDGFDDALRTASQEIADTAEDLAKPQRPATGSQLLAAKGEAAKDQLKANFMVSCCQLSSSCCGLRLLMPSCPVYPSCRPAAQYARSLMLAARGKAAEF